METVKVRLKNRVLTVPAENKARYLAQGYTVYDTDGTVIAEPATAENELKKVVAENEALKAEIEALKAEIPATAAETEESSTEATETQPEAETEAKTTGKTTGKTKTTSK